VKATFWDKYYAKLLFPIVLSSFVIFVLCAKLLFIRRFPAVSAKYKIEGFNLSQKIVSLFSFMVVGFYTLLISTVVQPFNCTKQSDGTYTLTKAPSLKCYDETWNKNLPMIIIFFVLYGLSIPAVMIYVFFTNRKQKLEPAFVSKYFSLMSPYRPRFFYFEIVLMLKRALFVISNDFLSIASYIVRYFSGIGTLLLFLWIESLTTPYQNDNFNQLSSS
jgi:hypothetical protein